MEFQSHASAGDGSFPSSTISALVGLNDGSALFYFRGQTFFNIDGRILKSSFADEEIMGLSSSFDELFYPGARMDFGDFVRHYGPHINSAGCSMISYLTTSDYIHIFKSSLHGRVATETSYAIFSLKELLAGDEMDGWRHRVSYNGQSVSFEYCDGICDISLEPEGGSRIGKHFMISNADELKGVLLRGMLLLRKILTGEHRDSLLIDAIPFDVRFGPQWGEMVPMLVGRGTSIPTRYSDNFDFVGTDHAAVRIGDTTVRIDVAKAFGYIPKEIEFTVEVNAASVITLTMTDRARSRSVDYRLSDLL